MGRIKAVFFDLGGTLRIADRDPEYMAAAEARMARLAGDPDTAGFIEKVEARYAVYRKWALSENKESGDYELWAKWLLPELPEEKLREICHEITYEYRQAKGKRHVVEGGREVIEELDRRGFKLGIISNLIGENEIPDWLKADGLDRYFSTVILSSVTHIRKPDPRAYLMACEELGVLPEECASVADNLDRDITGAKAAGNIYNILFISESKLKKKTITDANRPDYIVHRFIDILDVPVLKA